jgi:shikimate dehydrogenase
MITAKTSVYGVLGHPISHSLSPVVQNYFAVKLGHDLIYTAFHVLPDRLRQAITGAYSLGVRGINVTVPHKRTCMEFCARIDSAADKIKAVNTLKYESDGYVGYNTDWIGFTKTLSSVNVSLKDSVVMILGAGGGAYAACIAAAEERAARIIVANRTLSNAVTLANHAAAYYKIPVDAITLQQAESGYIAKDIVIQTTSAGLANPNESPIAHPNFFKGVALAFDLIYDPIETKFLEMARMSGIKTVNGLPMLFFQAAESYSIWRDIILSEDFVLQSIKEVQLL